MHLYKSFTGDLQFRQNCIWFIINAQSWNKKIALSKYLEPLEVASAVIHAIKAPYDPIRNRGRLSWPTKSFTMKYNSVKSNNMLSPKKTINVSLEEAANDRLFQAAASLGVEKLRPYAEDQEEMLRVLEIAQVMHA